MIEYTGAVIAAACIGFVGGALFVGLLMAGEVRNTCVCAECRRARWVLGENEE